jgi:hypothetical protein
MHEFIGVYTGCILKVLTLAVIDVGGEIKVGFGMLQDYPIVEIAGYAIGAVQVDISRTVTALGRRYNLALDVVDSGRSIEGSK